MFEHTTYQLCIRILSVLCWPLLSIMAPTTVANRVLTKPDDICVRILYVYLCIHISICVRVCIYQKNHMTYVYAYHAYMCTYTCVYVYVCVCVHMLHVHRNCAKCSKKWTLTIAAN